MLAAQMQEAHCKGYSAAIIERYGPVYAARALIAAMRKDAAYGHHSLNNQPRVLGRCHSLHTAHTPLTLQLQAHRTSGDIVVRSSTGNDSTCSIPQAEEKLGLIGGSHGCQSIMSGLRAVRLMLLKVR